jgi:hypothetical protein
LIDRELSLTELRVPGGGEQRTWVRWELFIFRDVRDVLSTRDADRVLVVHHGPPRIDEWLDALRESGLIDGRAPR